MTITDPVGLVGMGRMGAAMAGTLARAGYPVVVYNRSVAKAEAVAQSSGAEVVSSAAEVAARARIVLSSLADDEAVRSVHTGPAGTAEGLTTKSVLIETSTIDPRTLHTIEPTIGASGAILLDGPVSGSVPLVEQGKLTFMVGGDGEALEVARPVLEALSARIFHVGDLGAGATIKLAVNAIIHSTNVALSEALALAERAGVERKTAYEIFAASAAGSPFVLYKQAAFEDPDSAGVAFSLDLVQKDLELILQLAQSVGLSMAQGDANSSLVGEAIEAGFGERDMSAVASYLR